MENSDIIIPPGIFKAYDIRGFSPGEITEEIAYRLGQAVVKETKARVVVVGKDMRLTSVSLEEALIQGIISQGATVRRIGLTSTPLFYFAVAFDPTQDAGVMVTASHNPAEYNGFKIVRSNAVPIGQGSGMETLRERVMAGRMASLEQKGAVEEREVLPNYLSRMKELMPPEKIQPMKIVIDAGNGMAGHTLPALLEAYPCFETENLYFELDGTFPNHEANPLKAETLVTLQKRVRETGAALGIAYDGDADRVGIVDERGEIVDSYLLLALLAKEYCQRVPGATVMYDVRCGRVVSEEVLAAGGKPVMCRVGHAFIKKQLADSGAVLAGELSGHFYFKDFFGVDCTDLVFLLIATMVSETGKPLSELIEPLRRYAHSGEINFTVTDKAAALARIEERYSAEANSVWREDGIRLDFADWWVSVRSSNTEPLLRLVLEAKTQELMEQKRDEISRIIEQT